MKDGAGCCETEQAALCLIVSYCSWSLDLLQDLMGWLTEAFDYDSVENPLVVRPPVTQKASCLLLFLFSIYFCRLIGLKQDCPPQGLAAKLPVPDESLPL